MYANFQEESEEEKIVTDTCFVTTADYRSTMTSKVRALLESFEIPFRSYDEILANFDNTLAWFNDVLISVSSDAKKFKSLLLDCMKRLELKCSRIDKIELQLIKVMCDRDCLRTYFYKTEIYIL